MCVHEEEDLIWLIKEELKLKITKIQIFEEKYRDIPYKLRVHTGAEK